MTSSLVMLLQTPTEGICVYLHIFYTFRVFTLKQNLKLKNCLHRWRKCFLVFLIVIFPLAVSAAEGSSRHQKLNAHFLQTVSTPTVNLELKLNSLLSVALNEEEKAWLIYRWVTYHFKHDERLAGRIGEPSKYSLEKLHKLGGGSCAVYANVVQRMMQMAGLEVKTIYGMVKGGPPTARRQGKPVNHVWNAVRINGVWKVVDATWGAGFVDEQGFQSLHSDLFFLLPPEKAILSHYDSADELGYQKAYAVDQSLFAKLPEDALYAAAAGLDPKLILDTAKRESRVSLVSTFDLPPSALQVLSAPVNGVLERKSHTFSIESAVFEELMVVQGKSWVPLKKSGKVHSLTLVPTQGELLVMGRRPKQHDFEALLAYRVR